MKIALIVCLLFNFCEMTFAQEPEEYLIYDIPAGAKKIGPVPSRDPDLVSYRHYLPNREVAEETLIGEETYRNGILIQRELLKNGQLHGVQKKWHANGKLESEEPYRDGVMHGSFRHWNEAGILVGQYQMTNGTGIQRIYTSDGELAREAVFTNSMENGLLFSMMPRDGRRCLVWRRDGNNVGKSFTFYRDGSLYSVTCATPSGVLSGPYIRFDAKGNVAESRWFLNGMEKDEAAYAAAAAADPKLPPYHKEGAKYHEYADLEVRALLKRYRNLPRVKIPIELDLKGVPIAR
jgi:hypothetical protein